MRFRADLATLFVVLGKSLVRSEPPIPRVQNGCQSLHLTRLREAEGVQRRRCAQESWIALSALPSAGRSPLSKARKRSWSSYNQSGSGTPGPPLGESRQGWAKRFPLLFTEGLGKKPRAVLGCPLGKPSFRGPEPPQFRGRWTQQRRAAQPG